MSHDHYGDARCDECDAVTQRMSKKIKVKTVKDTLVAARELIQNTGWCQGQYSLKNGKTYYNFIHGDLADSYCLVGALSKITHDFWMQEPIQSHETQIPYNRLAWAASHWVVELQSFKGCPADWNDQDDNVRLLNEFTQQLREKQVPRDKAKGELNKFKQELKAKNLPPFMTKEKVLAAIDKAIATC
jgi:hypothetical protein